MVFPSVHRTRTWFEIVVYRISNGEKLGSASPYFGSSPPTHEKVTVPLVMNVDLTKALTEEEIGWYAEDANGKFEDAVLSIAVPVKPTLETIEVEEYDDAPPKRVRQEDLELSSEYKVVETYGEFEKRIYPWKAFNSCEVCKGDEIPVIQATDETKAKYEKPTDIKLSEETRNKLLAEGFKLLYGQLSERASEECDHLRSLVDDLGGLVSYVPHEYSKFEYYK